KFTPGFVIKSTKSGKGPIDLLPGLPCGQSRSADGAALETNAMLPSEEGKDLSQDSTIDGCQHRSCEMIISTAQEIPENLCTPTKKGPPITTKGAGR
ncbi:MAG TPA: hypothetical protein VF905_11845, partial [Nitrospirota bacterium]